MRRASTRSVKKAVSYAEMDEDDDSLESERQKKARQRDEDGAFEDETPVATLVIEEADDEIEVSAVIKKRKKKSASTSELSRSGCSSAGPLQRSTSALGAKEWVDLNPVVTAGEKELKVVSFNVNGLRSFLLRSFFDRYVEEESPDILCLQETKANPEKKDGVPSILEKSHPHQYWSHSVRPAATGYAGTAVLSRIKPVGVQYGIGVDKFDLEGRVITLEYAQVFLVCSYHPNSGKGGVHPTTKLPMGLDSRSSFDDAFEAFIVKLQQSKPVIVVGDLNVAPQAVDLYNPKGNLKSAGFTQKERDNFARLLQTTRLVDVWRHHWPVEDPSKTMAEKGAYSYWGVRRGDARLTNKGWRVDLMLVDPTLLSTVRSPFMRKEVRGSDHTAIGFVIDRSFFEQKT